MSLVNRTFARATVSIFFDRAVSGFNLTGADMIIDNMILERLVAATRQLTPREVPYDVQWAGFHDYYIATLKFIGPNITGSVFVPANIAYSEFDGGSTTKSNLLLLENIYGMPTLTLTLLQKSHTTAVFTVEFDRRMIDYDPRNSTQLVLTGGYITTWSNLTNGTGFNDVDMVPLRFVVQVSLTEDRFSAEVPYNVTGDALSQPNPPSGDGARGGSPLVVEWLNGHNAEAGIHINGQYVPWGHSVCLSNANKRHRTERLEDCYEEVEAEGGKYILVCEVDYFTIEYTEDNDHVYAVPLNGSATYANVLRLDGVNIYSQVGARSSRVPFWVMA
jgi:hypothetical protein